MKSKVLGVAVAAATMFAGAAYAAPFGPATASLGSFDVPTVNLTANTITLNKGGDQLNAGTGSLASTPYSGVGSGTISFSRTPNTIVGNPINSLFTFNDNAGGTYEFDLTSADTIAFSDSPGVSTSISLYLLGSLFDTNLNLSATPTSLTFQVNSTGGSTFSEAGSLSNPPTAVPVTPPATVPEPASIALLGAGLVGLGLIRRKSAKNF